MKHDNEIKVRLTDSDAELLKHLARASDMPPAVLARMLIVRGLTSGIRKVSAFSETNGRVAQAL